MLLRLLFCSFLLSCYAAAEDTREIQALLERGGHVRIPPGIYTIDRVRVTEPGTVIDGAGQVTFRMINAGNWYMVLVDKGVGNVTLRGLTLDGNESKQSAAAYSACIRTTLSDNITIENCRFINGGDRAVDIRGGHNLRVVDCTFRDCGVHNPDGNGGNAISIDKHGAQRPDNVFVTGNFFQNVGDCAIGVPACDYGAIAHNIIQGNPEGGMSTESGISVNGSKYFTISGNVVLDQAAGGIFVWDRPEEPCIGVTVTGNTLRSANITCRFWQPGSHAVTVSGNTLIDSYIVGTGDSGRQLCLTNNAMHGKGIVLAGKGNAAHFIEGNNIFAKPAIEVRPTVAAGFITDNLLNE